MRNTKAIYLVLALVLGILTINVVAFGQSTAGSINGVVTDPSGAVLPSAQVTLLNLATGNKLQTVTNNAGTYNFRNLQVGTYSVRIEVSGFSIQEITGLVLSANQTVTADAKLKVSGAQNSVEVSAAPSLIDTQSSHLADVLTGSALLNMSLLQRQKADSGLIHNLYFMPGSQNPQVGSQYPSINGVSTLDTLATMDGIVVMANLSNLGGGPVQPSMEAVQEVHTVLANAPAEFWRSAAITVVSKSGTNAFHGSLFYDYNSNAFNAKSFFARTVPFQVENNFAASIGGPIKKDKLFFFADYEGGRNAGALALLADVPLPAWRTGDFSSLSQPLINPYTGNPFPGNQIPANLISPVSLNIQQVLYPLPNFGPAGLESGNWRKNLSGQNGFSVFDMGDLTIDYKASKADSLFIRESYRHIPLTSVSAGLPAIAEYVENRTGASGVISEVHTFSPTLQNEFRFGYTLARIAYNQVFDGYKFIINSGMTGPFVGIQPQIETVPVFNIDGVDGSPVDCCDVENNIGASYEWNDNLSWTWNRHLLKFGVDQIFDNITHFHNFGSVYGSYNFNGKFTTDAYADFLLGLPQQTQINTIIPEAKIHGMLLGIYAQDQFQINPRLTLNYGLRWEFQSPYSGAPYLNYGFDRSNGSVVIQTEAGRSKVSPFFPSDIPIETAAVAGIPSKSLMFSHYLNIYPRAGFAYRMFQNKNTVLRGAYGLYGSNVYASSAVVQLGAGGPFTGSSTFTNQLVNNTPLFKFPEPFLPNGTIATQSIGAQDPHLTAPYTSQWSLSLDQPLGNNTVFTLAYVGTASRNLLIPVNLNQPAPDTTPFSPSKLAYPNFNSVQWTQNGGVDNYNSLQVSMRKHVGRTLYVDTGFSWVRDLTDDTLAGNYRGRGPQDRFCIGCEYGNNGI
ncbi:MAG: carboxypeptidase regulatory-like domain-containing protein, partial [Acidobacteriaceae bacterium]